MQSVGHSLSNLDSAAADTASVVKAAALTVSAPDTFSIIPNAIMDKQISQMLPYYPLLTNCCCISWFMFC